MSTLRKPHLIKYTPEADEDLINSAYRRATLLGFVVGLRSMTPNALLAWTSEEPSPLLRGITGFLAVGEIIGDKLPLMPSRLDNGPFFGRLAFGALAGALVSRRFNRDPWQGAIRGAFGAAAGAFLGYCYRSLLSQGLDIPDFVGAIVEDGVAITVGLNVVSKTPEQL